MDSMDPYHHQIYDSVFLKIALIRSALFFARLFTIPYNFDLGIISPKTALFSR